MNPPAKNPVNWVSRKWKILLEKLKKLYHKERGHLNEIRKTRMNKLKTIVFWSKWDPLDVQFFL